MRQLEEEKTGNRFQSTPTFALSLGLGGLTGDLRVKRKKCQIHCPVMAKNGPAVVFLCSLCHRTLKMFGHISV